jgi:glutamyl-tRNA synthetase
VAPYVQTERRPLYKEYAELLMERGHAYRCFCEKTESEEDSGEFNRGDDPCRSLSREESDRLAAEGKPYVIRQRIPHEGTTTFHDEIYGDITAPNADLDDQVLIKRDGLPTYNFANVVDDHLMGITHVVRGAEYLSSSPKYNLLYEAFGWEIPKYIHCPSVMITDPNTGVVRKMSKRYGDPSYEDLLAMGYLPEAIVNYVTLLGWSPRGELSEKEFFTMDELIAAFDAEGISKSPSAFDIEKLNYFNSTYLKNMDPEAFSALAMDYVVKAVDPAKVNAALIPALVQSRINKLSDIPELLDFFNALPDYDAELFENKKNKLTKEDSLDLLSKIDAAFRAIDDWKYDTIHNALYAIAESEGAKIGKIMWPARIAAAGKAVTPGGAIEICEILGKEETLRRFDIAKSKLN